MRTCSSGASHRANKLAGPGCRNHDSHSPLRGRYHDFPWTEIAMIAATAPAHSRPTPNFCLLASQVASASRNVDVARVRHDLPGYRCIENG